MFRVMVLSTKEQHIPPQPAGCPPPPGTVHYVDPRRIDNGTVMLRAGYLDQPYCVVLDVQHTPHVNSDSNGNRSHNRGIALSGVTGAGKAGRWVCTITGSEGPEGSHGEHVQALWSNDAGRTWSHAVTVEPAPNNTEIANAYSTIVRRSPCMRALRGLLLPIQQPPLVFSP